MTRHHAAIHSSALYRGLNGWRRVGEVSEFDLTAAAGLIVANSTMRAVTPAHVPIDKIKEESAPGR